MKPQTTFIIIAAAGLTLFALLKKRNPSIPSAAASLQQQADTDNVVGRDSASWILDAPDATAALNRGNATLQQQQGLDLTSPVWQANMGGASMNPDYNFGQEVTNAWQAVTAVTSTPSFYAPSNPYASMGGSYPRTIDGIFISNPNVQERLRIAWDNAHAGFNH